MVSFESASRDTQTLEQILCITSCEFDERAAKPKFVAQRSRPALYYSQQQVHHAR